MKRSNFAHYNHCTLCPIIGAEQIAAEEFFEFWSMRFRIDIARQMASGHRLVKVGPDALDRWLGWAHIDKDHVDHVPLNKGFGVVVTLPNDLGEPMIDGNHRALAALVSRRDFFVAILNETETLTLLRLSMGIELAEMAWNEMTGHRNEAI